MLKRVVIITDDSGTILPSKNKWKSKLGKGIDIHNHQEINALLSKNNLQIPKNDLNNEKEYRDLLKDYVTPARFMYAGMFSEVRIFTDELQDFYNVDLYIISGRYGLINQNDEIIPHKYHIDTIEKLESLDLNLKFSQKILGMCKDNSMIILCLPKHYISYLKSLKWFDKIPNNTILILITSTEFSDLGLNYKNIKILPRKGVCRIGRENKIKILNYISEVVDSEMSDIGN